MNYFKKIFSANPPKRIRLSKGNVDNWPSYSKGLKEGKLKFDKEGRLRYLHGAPVGDLIIVRINKDGTPKYKESTEEWFDPDGDIAKKIIWFED